MFVDFLMIYVFILSIFYLLTEQVIAAMCSKVPLISNAIMKSTGSGMNRHLFASFYVSVFSPVCQMFGFSHVGNSGMFEFELHVVVFLV